MELSIADRGQQAEHLMDPNLANPDVSLFSSETKDLMDVAQISDVPRYHGMLARRIHQLECELLALKSCHNAVTLTCRLPPEILSRIFIDLASMGISAWYAVGANKRPRKVSVSWLRVTFVCRHWRSVALQCPSLWSNLVFSNANLAEAMLTRSKGAPLTIWYNGMNDNPSSVLTTALSSVDRLRSVNLTLDKDSYIQPAPLAWAQKTGPTLTSFEMSYDIRNSVSLPKEFLRAMIRCGCTWGDLPIGPSITHLSLDAGKVFSGDTHRPTLSMFVYSLQQMPHLQCLNLSGFLPSEADTQYPEPIYIPSLRSLSLEDDARIIEVSLRILRVPRGAKIDLNPRYFNNDTNNIAGKVAQTLRDLRGFVPTNRAFRKLLLRVERQDFESPHFEFWFEEGVDETLARPCLTLSFHGHLMDSFPDYVTLIHNRFGSPDMMSLHLKGYLHLAALTTLRTTLGQIPQLKTITFEAFLFMDIPEFFGGPTHLYGMSASSNEGGCSPNLTIINCVALDMRALKDDDFPEVIVRMLDGVPHAVREINFRNCINFRKERFDMMKEKAPSVLFFCDSDLTL
ncbi:hypothetical protein D9611_002801 [Ephemerocybe angulata]|uniref:F-box domain-containing protein n=1 Tax=Ephemerocybe angulata TaxID=980116 RepID=A0A8H5FDU7_9AGAR|nr:hypothetical protein D9611_002801 [Tulosesus angulatus]